MTMTDTADSSSVVALASSAPAVETSATVQAPAAPDLGFAHFIARSDAVGQGLFVILVVMSLVSWALIVTKGVALYKRERRSKAFLDFFWNATSLEAVQHEIAIHGVSEPFAHLTSHAMHAQAHHARYGAAKLEEAGSAQEFLTRTIKKVLDEDTMRMESGLSVLATIGATAPFVGLFGTVWGVYHALVAIAATGAGTLDKVAGPVGEALIMTGVGLAVAIPAVMAYNWLTRSNRVWGARLDAFAFELFAFLSTGQTLKTSSEQDPTHAAPAANVRTIKHGTNA
jgi:biopolymer transport protein ExbB